MSTSPFEEIWVEETLVDFVLSSIFDNIRKDSRRDKQATEALIFDKIYFKFKIWIIHKSKSAFCQ